METIQARVAQYLKERGWDQLHPSDIAKSICIEAAELLEVFQWDSLDIEQTKADPERMNKIREEAADIFIYLFELAALLDLDSRDIVLKKLAGCVKKYPAAAMRAGRYYEYKAKARQQ